MNLGTAVLIVGLLALLVWSRGLRILFLLIAVFCISFVAMVAANNDLGWRLGLGWLIVLAVILPWIACVAYSMWSAQLRIRYKVGKRQSGYAKMPFMGMHRYSSPTGGTSRSTGGTGFSSSVDDIESQKHAS